ncbi:MAG: tellurite resistance TerB family protein [Alphaproteobacteria bacterium]|nr:tellurite resistance TerB family protein [Alphaproteobacteria bacterium]
MKPLNHHSALIYVMVIVSAADGVMSDRELHAIGEIVKTLPAFRGFEQHRLLPVAQECAAMLREPDSLDAVLSLVREALPHALRETAYALAVEIALTDSRVMLEELRVVDLLRRNLGLDRLVAAAIERGARARYQISPE